MCGGPIRQLLSIAQMVSSVQEETVPHLSRMAEKRVLCSTCNTHVQDNFVWCPSCGAALKDQPCTYCGQPLSPQDKTCSACGAPQHSFKNKG